MRIYQISDVLNNDDFVYESWSDHKFPIFLVTMKI